MESINCPLCGGPLRCLGGASAHHSNWYCQDEKGCGWEAWSAHKKKHHPVCSTVLIEQPAAPSGSRKP